MNFRALIASLCFALSVSAVAQLTADFYLEKTIYAPSEPVFLYLKLTNTGPDTVQVFLATQEHPFCSGNSIEVTRDPRSTSSCPNLQANSCVINGPMPPQAALLPGQFQIERFLLNFNNEISAQGSYRVDAVHVGSKNHVPSVSYFRVDENAPAFPADGLQQWVEQLQSPIQENRYEAARTLASLAPLSLQETLLGFADNPEFRGYAPLAFHRLNTPRSIRALADLMKASAPGTLEHLEAARYLAQTNDQQWYPLLLDAAEKNAMISSYPAYAAELGGSKVLPFLVSLANKPHSRLQAVMAIGSTGSRQAIPILLDLLKDPEIGTRDLASYSLKVLTHRTARQASEPLDQQTEYNKWSKWWRTEGANAPIYKDSECGETVPLP